MPSISFRRDSLWARLPVLCLAGAAVFAGCTGGSTVRPHESYSSDADTSPEAFLKYSDSYSKLGYRWDWSGFPKPASGERVQFLDAYPDAIVTLDTGSKLTVIEPGSGQVRWATEAADPHWRLVGSARDESYYSGMRLVAATDAEVFLLDMQTGNLLGRQRIEKVVNTRPLIAGGTAIFGTPTGEVLGHRLNLGVKAWGFDSPGSIESRPIRVENAIGAVTQAGYVVFVDAGSGALLGRNKMYGGVSTDPVATADLMIVASQDQSLYAFTTSGQTVWRKRTSKPLNEQPAVSGNKLYCTIADTGFTCFDTATGDEKWSNKEVDGWVIASRKGRLMVWNGKTMSVVDPASGALMEQVDLPDAVMLSFDAPEDGNMYVLNRGGVVGRFVPRS